MTEEEHKSYQGTVNTVLTTVILGSLFQIFTFGMMIFAFFIIDVGLGLKV